MNKVNELENKMNEILQDVNIKDLSEVGYENLRNMISSISEEIEKEARLANVDILRNLTLDEMGNPKDRDAVEFDDDAFNKMASIKVLLDKAEDIQIALGNEERVKKEQAHTRMHRIFAIHGEKRVISNQIKMMELQIKSERDRLAGPLISEVLKEDIKVGINDLNARIERLKEHLDTLDMEEIKLKEEIQILREGGKLNLDFEEQKVNESNTPENKKDEELNNTNTNTSPNPNPSPTPEEENKNDEEFPPLDEEPEQEDNKEDNKENEQDTPEAQPQAPTQTQAQTTGLKKGKKYGVKKITKGLKGGFYGLLSAGSGILSISSTAGAISALSASTAISAAVGATIYAIPAIACAVFAVVAAKKAINYFKQNKSETETAGKSK